MFQCVKTKEMENDLFTGLAPQSPAVKWKQMSGNVSSTFKAVPHIGMGGTPGAKITPCLPSLTFFAKVLYSRDA